MATAQEELIGTFGLGSITLNTYIDSDLTISIVKGKTDISKMDRTMDRGWVIMASWNEDSSSSMVLDNLVKNAAFRPGKNTHRAVLTVDVPLAAAWDTIPKIDADEPRSRPEIILGMRIDIAGRLNIGVRPVRGTRPGIAHATESTQAVDHWLGHRGDDRRTGRRSAATTR